MKWIVTFFLAAAILYGQDREPLPMTFKFYNELTERIFPSDSLNQNKFSLGFHWGRLIN